MVVKERDLREKKFINKKGGTNLATWRSNNKPQRSPTGSPASLLALDLKKKKKKKNPQKWGESKYEECLRKRPLLNLTNLSHSLKPTNTHKPFPVKMRVRNTQVEAEQVRRSSRVGNKPPPSYTEDELDPELTRDRSSQGRVWPVGAHAIERAEQLQSGLDSQYPSFVKPMLNSHPTGSLGLPLLFCKNHLPPYNKTITLVDKEGNEFRMKYHLLNRPHLSGGWTAFSIDHELIDGDALVFHLVMPTTFKVYIIRAFESKEHEENEDNNDHKNKNEDSDVAPLSMSAKRIKQENTKMESKLMTYEECRRQRLEENKKRMEELNLTKLSESLRPTNTHKPVRKWVHKPQVEADQVRRSSRIANKPPPNSTKASLSAFCFSCYFLGAYIIIPDELYPALTRKSYQGRVLPDQFYAWNEKKIYAIERAEQLQSGLDYQYPSFVRPLCSSVTRRFFGGLPLQFCKNNLPLYKETITLVDEEGNEFPMIYYPERISLGGWRAFSVDHELVDGDALVFQLVKPTTFKVRTLTQMYVAEMDGDVNLLMVYIIRAYESEEQEDNNDNKNKNEDSDVAHLSRSAKRIRQVQK
ncbi:hypothetical protein JRO89_XS02G0066600 [Xanthoceras sorbifolium]|uniref:TF-B3 domain-containing protein n=1 Tax=Xanthoceras sorbifolium TaxID=99658 RepID=A0ABQ8IF93_9ROSI|nr:hypothetical protein JRO89_XS02G0066600 [Xanthoceras sorbifolium]